MKKSRTSTAFAAPYANGSRILKAVGTALVATIPNTSTTVAGRRGILLPRAGAVPAAAIDGAGPRVCAAPVGRGMNTGMKVILRSRDVRLLRDNSK